MRSISGTPLRILLIVFVIALAGSCSDSTGPSSVGTAGTQQVLIINGAVGSFAYFHLLWPHVELALADNPAFATIEPSSQGFLFPGDGSGNHEWFASSYAPWIDGSGVPYPNMEVTAFLSGNNFTHTAQQAGASLFASGMGLPAGIAAQQMTVRKPALPVVTVGPLPFFGTAPDAPTPVSATNATQMVALYENEYGVDLTPTPEELTNFGYDPTQQLGWEQLFVQALVVSAKALRDDLSNMIIVNMPGADPHTDFTDIPELQRKITTIRNALNGFYEVLAAKSGPLGSSTRADNVVIIIGGDTPKNPLVRANWPDGTPGGSNWMYVVGKGLLKRGWFGRVKADGTVVGYNPATGADDPTQSSRSTRYQTAAAIAYAATRRDAGFIENTLNAGALSTYEGVVRK